MYLTFDSLMDLKNVITGSNNITLRKVNVKPYGFDKIYVDKDLIKDRLYKLIDQYDEPKINYRGFYFALFDNIHGNGRACKILFVINTK